MFQPVEGSVEIEVMPEGADPSYSGGLPGLLRVHLPG
jgi:hypothetical protein